MWVATTGRSAAELRRRGTGAFDRQADEPLRQRIEQTATGRLVSRTANRALGAVRAGATLRALFERV